MKQETNFIPCSLFNVYQRQGQLKRLQDRQQTEALKACSICLQKNKCKAQLGILLNLDEINKSLEDEVTQIENEN